MAYDLRIRADLTDENGEDVATIDRTYTINDMASVERCFVHATKTGVLIVEGVEMETLLPGGEGTGGAS